MSLKVNLMHKLSTIKIHDSYYAFLVLINNSDEYPHGTRLFGFTTGKISRINPDLRAEVVWVFNKNNKGEKWKQKEYYKK